MYSTYRVKANEINKNFWEGIKEMFKDREIEIVVQDVEDETEYLLKTDANKKHLLKAVKNVENRTNLVEVETAGL
jgi:antitoxin YefM